VWQRFEGLLLAWWLRTWHSTLDIHYFYDDRSIDPLEAKRRFIYLFWHEYLMLPAYTHVRQKVAILISRHRDGERIAQVVRMLGGMALRGSTNRGGMAALRSMMRAGKAVHLAVTPDGPRGPRRVVQLGSIYLASRTGMPLVPIGAALSKCWRAKSWDRTAVAVPFSGARMISSKPIFIPDGLTREQLLAQQRIVQASMDDVQSRAEEWASSGAREPLPSRISSESKCARDGRIA
jgi:lysophospholipid acyltransferase (LPLAT)-like uncharacterized protein